MDYINAWGQTIREGDTVYRGARLHNSSEYKVGVVKSLKNSKPRVVWKFTQTGKWLWIDGERVYRLYCYETTRATESSPSAESLIKIDLDLQELKRISEFYKTIQNADTFISEEEFQNALDSFVHYSPFEG